MVNIDHLYVPMTDLDIANEEDAKLVFDEDFEKVVNRFELYLVERFFTEKDLNMRAMQ